MGQLSTWKQKAAMPSSQLLILMLRCFPRTCACLAEQSANPTYHQYPACLCLLTRC